MTVMCLDIQELPGSLETSGKSPGLYRQVLKNR